MGGVKYELSDEMLQQVLAMLLDRVKTKAYSKCNVSHNYPEPSRCTTTIEVTWWADGAK